MDKEDGLTGARRWVGSLATKPKDKRHTLAVTAQSRGVARSTGNTAGDPGVTTCARRPGGRRVFRKFCNCLATMLYT